MPGMDIFNNNAFSMNSLTTAIQDIEFRPSFLGSLGIFDSKPIRTLGFSIERKDNNLRIIKADRVGDPRQRQTKDRRNIRNLEVIRLAKTDELQASEIQGIRAFGSQTELQSVAEEVAIRQIKLVEDLEATKERHRLGAINGLLLDSDDSVIEDYFDLWGITRPSNITFNWATRTDNSSFVNQNVIRPIAQSLGGRFMPGSRIIALCGPQFFDAMGDNDEYKDTHKGFEDARMLRKSDVYGSREAYDITWYEYRGTDDGTRISIPPNECKFIVTGVKDLFQVAYAPAPTFEYVNTLGLPMYSRIVEDKKRDEYLELDVESHLLHHCTSPESLLTGEL